MISKETYKVLLEVFKEVSGYRSNLHDQEMTLFGELLDSLGKLGEDGSITQEHIDRHRNQATTSGKVQACETVLHTLSKHMVPYEEGAE